MSTLPHINDFHRPAKIKKQGTSLVHVQLYIDEKWQHYVNIGLTSNSAALHLPYIVVSNDGFVGELMHWLVSDATWLQDKTQKLALKTVMGYASSFKEYYCNKFRHL